MRKSSTFLPLLLSVSAAIGLTSSVLAQGELDDKRITSITVKYNGPETVAKQRILDNMSSKVGQVFSVDKIDDDIKNLVSKGLVDDVNILADPGDTTLRLIVEVSSQRLLAGVGFANNTKFEDKTLLKEVGLNPGTPITDALILEGRRKIIKKYSAFSYPDVVVSHNIRETSQAGYSDIIFTIAEGQKNVVREIQFRGNNSVQSHVLRNLMQTKKKGIFSFISKSGNIDVDKLEDDREKILEHYRNKGYLNVQAPEFKRVSLKDGRVDLLLDINEGPKYGVSSLAFGPMKIFKPGELSPAMKLAAGKAYSAKKISDDIRTIRSYYGSKGYADANVKPVITDAGNNQVNVVYKVTEGTFYRVGKVNIRGNNITRDRVIRQEIPLKPGDNFNTVDLETTRKRLTNLGYFSSVFATPINSTETGYRDIDVTVQEKKTGSFGFGVGFSSIDSIVGFINLEQSNFDIKNPWAFTGGGQKFGLSLRAGAETQEFSISLTEPWFLGRRLALGGELYYKGSQFFSDQYDQINVGGSINIRKPLGKRSSLTASYTLEKIDIDAIAGASQAFQDEEGEFLRSAIGLNYVYDNRNAFTNPRRGHKVDLGLKVAGLGGDVNTVTFSAKGSKHWNLWWDSILTLRGAVDVVEGSDVPIFERVFLGGARNLRGFDFRDVGPNRDLASDEVLGGNTSVFFSAEMTFPVVESVRVAAFYDVGFLNEDSFDFSATDLHADVGLGLRLNLPLGPLALDYAIPIISPSDDPNVDRGGQFNFYVNTEF